MLRAVVERGAVDGGQHPDQARNRVVGQVRIGGVALGAMHGQAAVEAAAPSDLDHLAQGRRVGGLADQAGVDGFAPSLKPLQDLGRAVDRRALLVAGDHQADGGAEAGAAPGEEPRRRGDEAGDGAFHVRRAAPVKPVRGHLGGEGIVGPRGPVAGRHHVRMPGEAEIGGAVADAGIEVVHVRRPRLGKGQPVAGEPEAVKRVLQHVERPGVLGRDAGTADERAAQVKRVDDVGQSLSRSLIEVLERVFSSTLLTMTAQ